MRDAAELGLRRQPGFARARNRALRHRHAADTPAPGYRALFSIGIAAALSQAAEAGAFSGMTFIAGRIGEHAVAAYQIVLNLMAVVFMISLGLSTATAVLASEQVGRGDRRAAARVSFVGLGLTLALMLGLGVAAAWLRAPIGRAYTADLALAQIVAGLLPWAALTFLPDGGQVVAASALRAQGDNWFPTGSHLLAYACVMPALGFWLAESRGQGVAGLLWAILTASALSVGVLALRLGWLRKTSKGVSISPGLVRRDGEGEATG
jgi:MATE family multidrug resistance protein